jgi:hypothetical protein
MGVGLGERRVGKPLGWDEPSCESSAEAWRGADEEGNST